MIILLSIGFERSTDEIIDYFLYQKKDFIRINSETLKDSDTLYFNYNLLQQKTEIKINNNKIDLNLRKIIWYRRISNKTYIDNYLDSKIDFDNSRKLSQFIFKDWDVFLRIFVERLSKNSLWFDFPFLNKNKIDILNLAVEVGLKIPDTIIANNFDRIRTNDYITKPLDNGTSFIHDNRKYTIFTTIISKINRKFIPSLIQEKIEKKYEIRTFYLDGEYYSMAIFSQNDKQTQVDFRQYNYSKPNRNIPYKLPLEIEEKLKKLMDGLQLKTGSIDIIKGIDGEYYFLEVNPVGQFGMTSKPCNYNLEKKIYEKLISYEEDFK